jgi:alpha-L-arabinofuranosidase
MRATYHVAKGGKDTNTGSEDAPFLTISAAARVAQPGDTVLVHAGTYREWVSPRFGGLRRHAAQPGYRLPREA